MTDTDSAVTVLSSLAQAHRLDAFRCLVAAEPDGLAAGELARQLGIAPAALSFHLTHLGHAGLVTSSRQGRSIIYRANFAAMRDLLGYLTQDCCGGRPEICGDLLNPDTPQDCETPAKSSC
ncbi:MAG: metalloregulator ArsR/SmtB family transcription factor [Alphaproteobacteria bacterium]|nr:metalloregulator ArsR/SmtB family transcription factor [Alphaproteobacteria bacterium]